ncbi:MAG: DNA polymerase I, partial [Spirochaetales bacterium]
VDALPVLINHHTGRIHTHFIQTGTATGRLSSRDPNLQNIPIKTEEGRKIRSAFVAEKGMVFVSADYSQIELVVLAHLSRDPSLCEAFAEGKDVHSRTGSLIFGIPPEEVTQEQRRIAKVINFGIMYGMSAFRLAGELSIPRSTAAKFIETYFEKYSGIKSFIAEIVKEAEKTGLVTTILGRERKIFGITSRNKTEKMAAERIAVNTPIQGSAADIVKLAMIKVNAALKRAVPEARLLLQVHDELIYEVPEPSAAKAAEIIRGEMEKALPMTIPLRVSVETGSSWGDLH